MKTFTVTVTFRLKASGEVKTESMQIQYDSMEAAVFRYYTCLVRVAASPEDEDDFIGLSIQETV